MDAIRSARASSIAALRRLYGAVRRAVAAPDDAEVRADLDVLCERAPESATNLAGDDEAETRTR